MKPEVEEFARLLVALVRDEAVRDSDAVLNPKAKHGLARRWRRAQTLPARDAIETVIPDVVDATVFALLDAIDNGRIQLRFRAANGKIVDLGSAGAGEMGGWFAGGPGGWLERYSKERWTDPTSE